MKELWANQNAVKMLRDGFRFLHKKIRLHPKSPGLNRQRPSLLPLPLPQMPCPYLHPRSVSCLIKVPLLLLNRCDSYCWRHSSGAAMHSGCTLSHRNALLTCHIFLFQVDSFGSKWVFMLLLHYISDYSEKILQETLSIGNALPTRWEYTKMVCDDDCFLSIVSRKRNQNFEDLITSRNCSISWNASSRCHLRFLRFAAEIQQSFHVQNQNHHTSLTAQSVRAKAFDREMTICET